MWRKIISRFCYVLAGFFVYCVCLLAFINMPQVGAFKFAIIGGFSIPALIFLVIGAAICRFQDWKSSIAIVVFSGVGVNLLVIISMACILLTPELKEFFPDNKIVVFSDYFSGFSVMLGLAGLAGFLLKTNKGKVAEPCA